MALISSVDVWLLQDKGLPTHGPSLTARLQAVDARLATSTERYASEVSLSVSKTGDTRMLMPTRYIYSNNVLMSFSVPSTTILHRVTGKGKRGRGRGFGRAAESRIE